MKATLDPVAEAERVIREAIAFKFPVVAFSGGCDSLVALHLTLKQKPDVLIVFNNTGEEYPETLEYVYYLTEAWDLNFRETRPESGTSLKSLIAKYGPITFTRRICTHRLKVAPLVKLMQRQGVSPQDFITITGKRLGEGKKGMSPKPITRMKGGWRTWMANPLWLWSRSRVWFFIRSKELPYNPLYDKGARRVGCKGCLFEH